jgi:glucose-6-phosphate-specific signal transduction histidine kinase
VEDDGIGGADPTSGSGLRGLQDRVTAIGGRLSVEGPSGEGTRVRAEIPVVGPRMRHEWAPSDTEADEMEEHLPGLGGIE